MLSSFIFPQIPLVLIQVVTVLTTFVVSFCILNIESVVTFCCITKRSFAQVVIRSSKHHVDSHCFVGKCCLVTNSCVVLKCHVLSFCPLRTALQVLEWLSLWTFTLNQ